VSPPGENLYVSVVLRPDAVRQDFSAIGLAVGVGLAAGLPVDVELKWPNDLLIGGRKVAGILCESRWLGARPDVVVGFGINVHQRAFDPSIRDVATSLALHGHAVDRAELLAAVLLRLEDTLDVFVADGFVAVRARYEARCAMLGRPVTVSLGEENVEGVAETIEDGGALRLRTAGGVVRRIEVGDVSLR
jgi:BirA family biotin operon repressor/biotin-[acetyl-CoA-carboxylase] ligase